MIGIVGRCAASLLYPVIVGGGIWLGGWACWVSFVLGGTVYPLIDTFWHERRPRTRNKARTDRAGHRSELALLIVFTAVQFVLLAVTLHLVAKRPYEGWELLGIALSLGTLTGGIGIPASHELIHRRDRRLRALGVGLLGCVLYMHFRIEHVYGHHVRAATPDDPATARRGEGLWRFIMRSIAGQFASAFRIASRRRRRGDTHVNQALVYWLVELVLLGAILATLGSVALLVFFGQAVVAVIFLEATNYVEHYGLTRGRLANGRYEPMGRQHAWNTSSPFTNALTFNLGLHAHHHMSAATPYGALRNAPDAPQLPAGYLAMIALAAVPPVWRRIMDHRIPALAATVQPAL